MTCKVDEEFMSHGIKWFGPAMGLNPLTTLGQMECCSAARLIQAENNNGREVPSIG
jgi:hypothetical protein